MSAPPDDGHLASRLTADRGRFATAAEVRLHWALQNRSDRPLLLLRDRFDPARYRHVAEHVLTGVRLRLRVDGREQEPLASTGGPVGIPVTPAPAHYLELGPWAVYRFTFCGLQYTRFSADQPYRRETFQWLIERGELDAWVELDSAPEDPGLALPVWSGRVSSDTARFTIATAGGEADAQRARGPPGQPPSPGDDRIWRPGGTDRGEPRRNANDPSTVAIHPL